MIADRRSRTMLAQIAGKTPPRGAANPGTYHLNRSHQRIGEQQRPGQGVAELRSGLRVGRDPAGIVIRGPGDQTGAQHAEQSRLCRRDHRARTGVNGLLDFKRHVSPIIAYISLSQQQDQNDERDRDSDEPKQNGHVLSP